MLLEEWGMGAGAGAGAGAGGELTHRLPAGLLKLLLLATVCVYDVVVCFVPSAMMSYKLCDCETIQVVACVVSWCEIGGSAYFYTLHARRAMMQLRQH
jgi:hypothetical protein